MAISPSGRSDVYWTSDNTYQVGDNCFNNVEPIEKIAANTEKHIVNKTRHLYVTYSENGREIVSAKLHNRLLDVSVSFNKEEIEEVGKRKSEIDKVLNSRTGGGDPVSICGNPPISAGNFTVDAGRKVRGVQMGQAKLDSFVLTRQEWNKCCRALKYDQRQADGCNIL